MSGIDKQRVTKMRLAAAEFRKASIDPESGPQVAEVLAQVARDYELCADYIESLEERLAEFELGAIREINRRRVS